MYIHGKHRIIDTETTAHTGSGHSCVHVTVNLYNQGIYEIP